MNRIRLTAAVLALSLPFSLTSCFAWVSNTARGLNDKLFGTPDFVDSTMVVAHHDDSELQPDTMSAEAILFDTTEATEMTTAEMKQAKELIELSGELEFYNFNNDNCAVVYSEKGAWIFDYALSRVTPIVDFEEMLATADKTGRGREFFEDVSIEYEFYMNSDIQLRVTYNVKSNTSEASFSVYGFYMVHPDSYERWGWEQGSFYGYYLNDIYYPGVAEPVTVDDIADFEGLGVSQDGYVYTAARAFIENDIEELETQLGLDDGTLSSWKGVTVSDYTVTNVDPTGRSANTLRIVGTLANSKIERYPDGRYIIEVKDGLGAEFSIHAVSDENYETESSYTDAEVWAYEWAASYGGWRDIDKMVPTDPTFAHQMLDFFLYIDRVKGINGDFTREKYFEYSEKYFGFKDFSNDYTVYDTIRHDGHGGATMLCEVETVTSASGVHIIDVFYFADPLRSVVSRQNRVTLVETGDGEFKIDRVESVVSTEYRIFGWSV